MGEPKQKHTHTYIQINTTWQSQATANVFRKGITLQEFEGVFVTVEISHTVATCPSLISTE